MAFTYLLQAGLEGVLTSRSDFTCKITFIRAGLESLVLRVEPRGEEGLGFMLTEVLPVSALAAIDPIQPERGFG